VIAEIKYMEKNVVLILLDHCISHMDALNTGVPFVGYLVISAPSG
jgi:hypothetical protein